MGNSNKATCVRMDDPGNHLIGFAAFYFVFSPDGESEEKMKSWYISSASFYATCRKFTTSVLPFGFYGMPRLIMNGEIGTKVEEHLRKCAVCSANHVHSKLV